MIGELYETALAGRARPEIEHADGTTSPLQVDHWLHARPGDVSIVDLSGQLTSFASGVLR